MFLNIKKTMGKKEFEESFKEYKKGMDLLSKQLSQDKAMFRYLIDNNLVSGEGIGLIYELLDKHTIEFEIRNG
tara:strand:- start:1362 stop:1580 length:219 start_codon:yes stop_codon:yes gene_type:complete